VTAPLVLNPLMARMAEAAGFPAGYLGGGSTGYQKVALEANLNVTEMCQIAVDIGAVSSLPLILDGACGYGDPMHMHRTIGMSEAAGFQAIEIEDQLVPKRAHHHAGIEHMIPMELMAAKVKEAVAQWQISLQQWDASSPSEMDAAEIAKVKAKVLKSMSTSEKKSTKVAKTSSEERVCFRCQEPGHLAPNCPKKPKVNCYVCSEEGHLARDCPNRAESSEPKKEDVKGKKA
jgi:hypothetical protein